MIKVKFKIVHYDAIFFGRYSYLEVIEPNVVVQDRQIIVKGKNGEIAAVLPDLDRLIFVSAETID